jgi:hypothetical protein
MNVQIDAVTNTTNNEEIAMSTNAIFSTSPTNINNTIEVKPMSTSSICTTHSTNTADEVMVLSSYTVDLTSPSLTLTTGGSTDLSSTSAVKLADNTIAVLDGLRAVARSTFESHNKNVYQILGKCYELYYKINTSETATRQHLAKEVSDYYHQNSNIKARKLHTHIVHLVLADCTLDRRTVSRYASTLRLAFSTKTPREVLCDSMGRILPEQFAYWLSLYTIDKVQRDLSKQNQYTVEDALRHMALMRNMGEVNLPGLQPKNTQFDYKLLIARWDASRNTLVMVHMLEDESKVKALVSPMRKHIKEEFFQLHNQKDKEQKVQSKADAIQAARQEAA